MPPPDVLRKPLRFVGQGGDHDFIGVGSHGIRDKRTRFMLCPPDHVGRWGGLFQ